MKRYLAVLLFVCVLTSAAAAQAQYVTYYAPSVPVTSFYSPGYVMPPTVTQYYNYAPPAVAAGGIVAPSVTTYYAPSAIPTTTYYAPGYTTSYAPTTTYYGGTTANYGTTTTYYGSPYVVRSNVYYPGQPVRNTLRAIGP